MPESFGAGVAIADHVGVLLPDLEAGITFYRDVFGFQLIRGPVLLSAEIGARVYGEDWPGARLAHLVDDAGFGLELFELGGATSERSGPVWRSTGLFHLALRCPDLERAILAVKDAGGCVLSDVVATPRLRLCYTMDPWGTVLELVDTPFQRAHGCEVG